MALTADQLADFRADLGIDYNDVFTDTELDRLYTRAGEDYDIALYLAWRQLLASSAKFTSYTVGETQEDKDKIFDHIKKIVDSMKKEGGNNSLTFGVIPTYLTPDE